VVSLDIQDKYLNELIDIIRAGIVTKTIASELVSEDINLELIQELIAWCNKMEKDDE